MKNSLQNLAMAMVLGGAALMAQPSGNPPDPATMIQRRVAFLTTQLNLTSDQQASATKIYTDAQTASQSILTSLQTNRSSLSAAVKANSSASIDQLAATAGTLQGQLLAINSKADAAFYATLTADQKTLFDSLPHGPGRGPGGPPPGSAGVTGFRH